MSDNEARVLLLEGIHEAAVESFQAAGYSKVERLTHSLVGEDLAKALADVDYVGIRSRTQLDATAFDAAKKLKAVGCFCIGTNQVDLDAARRLGVPVFNAPFSNTRSVAELVIAEAIILAPSALNPNARISIKPVA